MIFFKIAIVIWYNPMLCLIWLQSVHSYNEYIDWILVISRKNFSKKIYVWDSIFGMEEESRKENEIHLSYANRQPISDLLDES